MKLLMVFCKNFGYTPTIKTLDNAPENVTPANYENVQVAFIHVEKEDEGRESDVEKKLVAGFSVIQTPFGYFLDLRIDAPGFSLARVFKNI